MKYRNCLGPTYVFTEVFLYKFQCSLVYSLVLVVLQCLYFVQSTGLLHHHSDSVQYLGTSSLCSLHRNREITQFNQVTSGYSKICNVFLPNPITSRDSDHSVRLKVGLWICQANDDPIHELGLTIQFEPRTIHVKITTI